MAFYKDTEREQLRQLVKACLLEISKLKIQLKKCQKESSQKQSENNLIKDTINSLQDLLKQQEKQLEELQKVKLHFEAITDKPKTDLTSFQSQVYQLLPEKEDTLEHLYNYITSIGFSELSNENFEYLLHNLERKNYCHSRTHNNQTLWKKIVK
jgi:uncharacterized phage infection (PIP) family protein YhgE